MRIPIQAPCGNRAPLTVNKSDAPALVLFWSSSRESLEQMGSRLCFSRLQSTSISWGLTLPSLFLSHHSEILSQNDSWRLQMLSVFATLRSAQKRNTLLVHNSQRTDIISLNAFNFFCVVISPFVRWENCNSGSLNDLSKVTQPISSRAGSQTQVSGPPPSHSQCSSHTGLILFFKPAQILSTQGPRTLGSLYLDVSSSASLPHAIFTSSTT